MSTTELPEIPGLNTDSESRIGTSAHSSEKERAGYSMVSLVVTAFTAVILASAVAVYLTFTGRDAVLELLGVPPPEKKEVALAAAIHEQQTQLKLIADFLDDTKKDLAVLHADADSSTFNLNKVTQRVTNLERFSSDLEKKVADQKKAQQIAAEKKQASVVAKPKPAPIIPLTLISIRTQAGVTLVALRDGLDKSDLLMPGDSWRGWTFLEADSAHKSARFQVAGKIQELQL